MLKSCGVILLLGLAVWCQAESDAKVGDTMVDGSNVDGTKVHDTRLSDIKVSDGYLQLPVPGQTRAAAFMNFYNSGQQARLLASVSCACASKVEIHSHSHENGMMKMRREPNLKLPAATRVELAPGGWHLMVFDLNSAVRTGQSVDMQLEFANGDTQWVSLAVKSRFDGDAHRHHL